ERRPRDVGVDVHSTGENNHARGVNGAAAVDLGNDAASGDADISDLTVYAIDGVVHLPAYDSKHGGSAESSMILYAIRARIPRRFLGHRLANPAQHFFISRVGRAQGRPKW